MKSFNGFLFLSCTFAFFIFQSDTDFSKPLIINDNSGYFQISKNEEIGCFIDPKDQKLPDGKNTEDCTVDYYYIPAIIMPKSCPEGIGASFIINFKKKYFEDYLPNIGRPGLVIRGNKVLYAEDNFGISMEVKTIEWSEDSFLYTYVYYESGDRQKESWLGYYYLKAKGEKLSAYGGRAVIKSISDVEKYIAIHARQTSRTDFFVVGGDSVMQTYTGNQLTCEMRGKKRVTNK